MKPFIIQCNRSLDWIVEVLVNKRQVTAVMLHVFHQYSGKQIVAVDPKNQELNANALLSLSLMMLDIGANEGFYGLLAGTFGYKVLLFDLQPECQTMIQNAIIVNNLKDHTWVMAAGVSEELSTMTISTKGCNMMYPLVVYYQLR